MTGRWEEYRLLSANFYAAMKSTIFFFSCSMLNNCKPYLRTMSSLRCKITGTHKLLKTLYIYKKYLYKYFICKYVIMSLISKHGG